MLGWQSRLTYVVAAAYLGDLQKILLVNVTNVDVKKKPCNSNIDLLSNRYWNVFYKNAEN